MRSYNQASKLITSAEAKAELCSCFQVSVWQHAAPTSIPVQRWASQINVSEHKLHCAKYRKLWHSIGCAQKWNGNCQYVKSLSSEVVTFNDVQSNSSRSRTTHSWVDLSKSAAGRKARIRR